MSTTINDELSRRYFFYHQDGLLDIFMGLGFLLAGAALWVEMPWMAGIWVVFFAPVWMLARQSITYRRVPEVETTAGDKARIVLVLSVLVGMVVLGVLTSTVFLLGFERFSAFWAFLDAYIHLMVGLGLVGLLATTAVILRLPRFYAYAALTLLVFGAGHLAGWLFWTSMSFTGGLISLGGFIVLGRFLRAHPAA